MTRIGPSFDPCATPKSIVLKKTRCIAGFHTLFSMLQVILEKTLLCQNLDYIHVVQLLGDREETAKRF